VKEWEGKIIFLHSVKPGCSDESYGIHVARLAGVPEPVLKRAELLLADLSQNDARLHESLRYLTPETGHGLVAETANTAQLSLFNDQERSTLDDLCQLDLDRISPMDAFHWLVRVRRELDDSPSST
jgi:DNA mismatch repair protein MutS